MWTGENLFKRFLAEHRGHSGLTISTAGACEWPSVANCGCGAFFMSWTHADGEWSARIGNALGYLSPRAFEQQREYEALAT